MKYLIMETGTGYAVALDEMGRFITVANMHYTVGQTVTDIVPLESGDISPSEKKTAVWPRRLAALAVCFVFVAFAMLNLFRTPYAYVYMTINPQVRIDINKKDMVIAVAGVNADGEILLSGYDCRNKSLDTVMDELVDRAIDMGYLYDGGRIKITLGGDAQWIQTNSRTIQSQLDSYVQEKISVTIQVESDYTSTHINIPAGDSGYGDSDYAAGTPGSQPQTDTAPQPDTDYGTDSDGITDYSDTDYGPSNDGVTDYRQGGDNEGMTDYGDTGYELPAADYTPDSGYDDGTSNYSQDGRSDYSE